MLVRTETRRSSYHNIYTSAVGRVLSQGVTKRIYFSEPASATSQTIVAAAHNVRLRLAICSRTAENLAPDYVLRSTGISRTAQRPVSKSLLWENAVIFHLKIFHDIYYQ